MFLQHPSPSDMACKEVFTYMSWSCSCSKASLAMHRKASSTLWSSFAEVSKYGILPLEAHQSFAFFSGTCGMTVRKLQKCMHHKSWLFKKLTTRLLPASWSTLFPTKMNGKCLGSDGPAWKWKWQRLQLHYCMRCHGQCISTIGSTKPTTVLMFIYTKDLKAVCSYSKPLYIYVL